MVCKTNDLNAFATHIIIAGDKETLDLAEWPICAHHLQYVVDKLKAGDVTWRIGATERNVDDYEVGVLAESWDVNG
jgi:hypothetical protein